MPDEINSIQALPGSSGDSTLYGAGDGVYCWQGTSRTSLAINPTSGISQLIARQDSSAVVLWMVHGDENLSYMQRQGVIPPILKVKNACPLPAKCGLKAHEAKTLV